LYLYERYKWINSAIFDYLWCLLIVSLVTAFITIKHCYYIFLTDNLASCYTGFFNVRRGWQSLNRDLGFIYVSSEGRVGCEFIHRGRPFKPKKLSVPFLLPGFPRPSPFFVSSPVAFKFWNVLVLNIAEKLLAGR
jgi:hypothetical protein